MAAWTSLERLGQDLRFGLRILRKNPSFTAVAVITLALGIGANTAIFSVVNGLLLRSLPFAHAHQLVWITNFDGSGGPSAVTSTSFTFRDLRRLNRSFIDMAAYNAFFPYNSYNLTGSGDPERLIGVDVTESFFSLLGVQPALGRTFLPEECQRNGRQVVILSQGFWKSKFAANPAIVGQALTINSAPVVVVGVMPADFDFASVFVPGARVDLFLPRFIDQETNSHGNEVAIIGRLKPGVTLAGAKAEMKVLIKQVQRLYPNRGIGASLFSLEDHVTGGLRRSLLVLACAVGFVLLIACSNLSNLLLVRATARKKEIAVRIAIGADRFRLIRQMLTESITLSLLGGILGLPLAILGTRILANMRRSAIPMLGQIGIDRRAFAFTLVVSAFAGILFGLVPALHASRSNISDALKEGTSGAGGGIHRNWTRGILVASEMALALILLGGAGLLMKSFIRLLDSDMGFRASHVAVVRIDPGPRFQNYAQLTAFLNQVVEQVRQIPGIEAAAMTDAVPLDRDRSWDTGVVGVTYPPGQEPDAFVRIVGSGYFDTMRIPLLQGRTFNEHDTAESQKVVIVNQAMARRLLPGQNPLGREINAGDKRQIIGVVADVKHTALEEAAGLEFYRPYSQGELESGDLVIRTTLEPDVLASTVRRAIWSFAPNQPVPEFRTLDQLVETAVSPRRFTMLLLGIFAGLALILASVGIYGVISYSVAQRTREMGIRMALGANPSQVEWQVVREAIGLSIIGTTLGIAGLLALSRYMSSLLFEVTPTDPVIFAAVTVLLMGVGVVASYVPARRAARINPITALRFE